MEEESLFRSQLEQMKLLARRNHNFIKEEEIKEAFSNIELTTEQLVVMKEYLRESGIKTGISDEDNEDPADVEEELLDEADTSYLVFYLEEIEGLPKYTQEEKDVICRKAFEGDYEAKQNLITHFLPEVVDIAKLYVGQGVTLEDLIGEGNIGLLMSMEILPCLETASEVEGHVGKVIMDAMEAAITAKSEEQEFDRNMIEKINRVSVRAKEMAEDLRHEVTPEELAEEMVVSVDEIFEVMRLTGYKIEGIKESFDD